LDYWFPETSFGMPPLILLLQSHLRYLY
jgi:hypothetical protein